MLAYATRAKMNQKMLLQLLTSIKSYRANMENRVYESTREKNAADIINKYLCEGTESGGQLDAKVNSFKTPAGTGEYVYTLNMFDLVERAVYDTIKSDQAAFDQFRLSNEAEALVRRRPHLAVKDVSGVFGDEKVQADLQELMDAAIKVANCDRMTAWMVNNKQLFSVCASGLSNIILRITLGQGLAGCAARDQQDLIVPDAWQHPKFDKSFDEKTGYRTKSVLCVVIFRNAQLRAVVQLLNKKGAAEGEVANFTAHDAQQIRDKVGPPLLNAFEEVSLKLSNGST